MIQSFKNIWNIPELRRRVLYTLGLLAIYRVGGHIPTPGIDNAALLRLFESPGRVDPGLRRSLRGGNFKRFTVFALGIMPYITASIILPAVHGHLALPREAQQGGRGRTPEDHPVDAVRHGHPVVHPVAGRGVVARVRPARRRESGRSFATPGIGFELMTVLTLTTGTAFIMWLGEQISERGIGNGISLIIYAGIVVGFPNARREDDPGLVRPGALSPIVIALLVILMVLVVAAIVYVERAQRKIPIQYARRVVGPARLRRGVDVSPAARQHGGRHPGDLRVVDARHPADDREHRGSSRTSAGCRTSCTSCPTPRRCTTCRTRP